MTEYVQFLLITFTSILFIVDPIAVVPRVLAGQARGPAQTAAVYGSIALTAAVSWVSLRIGERLVDRIGKIGIRTVTRLMGLLLAAVAVQFVITGVRDALAT